MQLFYCPGLTWRLLTGENRNTAGGRVRGRKRERERVKAEAGLTERESEGAQEMRGGGRERRYRAGVSQRVDGASGCGSGHVAAPVNVPPRRIHPAVVVVV